MPLAPQPAPVQQPLTSAPAPVPVATPTNNPILNPRPTGPAQVHPQAPPEEVMDPNNEIVQGLQHKEETINELISMGFGRAEIQQALTCAYYNKERAIDYLLNAG